MTTGPVNNIAVRFIQNKCSVILRNYFNVMYAIVTHLRMIIIINDLLLHLFN